MINTWSDILALSFANIWFAVVEYVPNLIVAVIIFILGWIIGAGFSKVVEQIIKAVKLDSALRAAGVEGTVNKAGFKLNSGRFLGEIVKWFVIVVFLVAALEVLGLSQVTNFLMGIIQGYLPQVVAAILILLIAVVIGDFMKKLVVGSARAAHLQSAEFLGAVTKWAIWIFAVLAALFQLGIAATFIQTLFTGAIVALSLALGLSFGLGGKEAAAHYIDKVRREISSRE